MIVRTLKLRPTRNQAERLDQWLWHLTGVYNWASRKIELDASDSVYHSTFDIQNACAGHSKTLGIPSHVVQGTICQASDAWKRCFKKLAKKPRLKGVRNRLRSIPFPDPIKPPDGNHIRVPGVGKIRFHKQALPDARIKRGRVIKRASGWYLNLTLDCEHKFPVKETDAAVGIDPGFSTLLTLSDGTKFENPRELRRGERRLAQAQRGRRRKLTARLRERQANRRSDRNHKISRKLVENYQTLCFSKDRFKNLAKLHGKSVSEASLAGLFTKISYKCRTGGRTLIEVASPYTTMTCSECGGLTGPRGLGGLAVRFWVCSACGAYHDRDINAGKVTLSVGLGTSLKLAGDG